MKPTQIISALSLPVVVGALVLCAGRWMPNAESSLVSRAALADPENLKNSDEFSDADYQRHLEELRTKIPDSDTFHVCLSKPFVVIGNEAASVVEDRAKQTVQWAVERLKRQYFPKDPRQIINVWLFKDKETYEKYNQELFGAAPHTPFGYYSSAHKALVMNISTGGGTLVHEIVHPFIESNFPECPSWFNEGLASLYEQCSDREGQIWGATNWRLAGLQKSIADRDLPTFAELCSTTTSEFYKSERGNNYAQARYLCYYLQNHGLLGKYYEQFRKNCSEDPDGYQSLVAILGEPDMVQFQVAWEKFVLRLRFP